MLKNSQPAQEGNSKNKFDIWAFCYNLGTGSVQKLFKNPSCGNIYIYIKHKRFSYYALNSEINVNNCSTIGESIVMPRGTNR